MKLPTCYTQLPSKEILQPLYDLADLIGVEVVVRPLLDRELGKRFYCNGRPCIVRHKEKDYPTTLTLQGDYGMYTRFKTNVEELQLEITWTHNMIHPSLGLFPEYLRFTERLVGYSYRHNKEERQAHVQELRQYKLIFPDFPWTKSPA